MYIARMKSLGNKNNLMCLPINTREWAVDFMAQIPRGYSTF